MLVILALTPKVKGHPWLPELKASMRFTGFVSEKGVGKLGRWSSKVPVPQHEDLSSIPELRLKNHTWQHIPL